MSDSDALKSRLDRLDGQMDTMKVVKPMTITVMGMTITVMAVLLAALVFVLNNMSATVQATNTRIEALGTKVDAIPQRLAEEFRAMRAETAAQTSAIANSVTAARQVQPQIMIMPPVANTDGASNGGTPSMINRRPPG